MRAWYWLILVQSSIQVRGIEGLGKDLVVEAGL